LNHRLSGQFHKLAHFCAAKHLTLKELVEKIGVRGRALIIFILSLPFVLFIALPGLSIIFGAFILFNGMHVATNKEIWFPRFLIKRKMNGDTLAKSFRVAEKIAKRLEKVIKPRGKFLAKHPHLQIVHGVIFIFCGFFLALPLPPGTNFLPGLTSAILSLGILEEDGVFVVLSYLIFLATLAFFILIPLYGIEEIKSFIYSVAEGVSMEVIARTSN
jgi:hypothetical protein